ncbi:MAG: DUF47 family protein [Erysipelotrichaceae bacterium]|jgi:uncharacterized protein Yka (UPF0111/DUF47 family)|nr:DUF47 family protein [Erysipelotrichaceae bacterium]
MKASKSFDYFDAFVVQAQHGQKMANELAAVLGKFRKLDKDDRFSDIHAIEHEADLTRHEITVHLLKEFLPPLESEDILKIADCLDDITDALEDVVIKLDTFGVTNIRPQAVKFGNLLVQCAEAVTQAAQEFKHFKSSSTLMDTLSKVKKLEEEGDTLYLSSVKQLYKEEKDAREVQIWYEVYYALEKAADCCAIVASAMTTAVMKNT